jgi:hypothetical protein
MLKRSILTLCAVAFTGTLLNAQARSAQSAPSAKPAPAPAPAAAAAKPSNEPPPLPVNIKIEVAITDQMGSNVSAKKVVTMIASDRQPTNVRSSASVPVKTGMSTPGAIMPQTYTYKTVQINVDARPNVLQKEPNKISVNFGLEYLPTTRLSAQEEAEPGLTSWNERLSVILESGKPMVVSQAADPTSDRRITVELTATILK